MKYFYIILLILTVANVSGQPAHTLKLVEYGEYAWIKRNKDSLHGAIKVTELINREVTPGYLEHVFEMQETDSGGYIKIYPVNVLSKAGEVIYYQISNKEFREVNRKSVPYYVTIDTFLNKDLFNEFERAFTENYHAPLNRDDLFKTSVTYGFGCGIAGMPTREAYKLQDLLSEKNIKTIRSWLRSANTETQLYGMLGLYVLKSSGYTPSRDDIRIMNIIRSKKGEVHVCGGCFYYTESILAVIKGQEKYAEEFSVAFLDNDNRKTRNKFLYTGLAAGAILILLAFVQFRILRPGPGNANIPTSS